MAVQIITFDPVTVVSAGTAVPLNATSLLVASVTIQASFTNVSKLTVGGANVSSSNGIEIPPGDTCTIEGIAGHKGFDEFYINEVFVNSTTTGDSCRIVGFKRRPV